MKKKQKKAHFSNKFSWVVMILVSMVFYYITAHFVVFPAKYRMAFLFGVVLIDLFIGCFVVFSKRDKRWINILSLVLSAAMISVSVYLPVLERKMTGVFRNEEETAPTYTTFSLYAFTKEYKEAHPDILEASVIKGQYTHVYKYAGAGFLIQNASDYEGQMYVLSEVSNSLQTVDLWTITKTSLTEQIKAFYSGEADLVIINDALIPDIEKMPGCESFRTDTVALYTVKEEIVLKNRALQPEKDILSEPFTVLVTGNDTRSLTLTQYGRTDVNILAVVDPVNYQVIIVSLPRDGYIYNPKLKGYDKLTHLGVNGVRNSMKGISDCFDIPMDYYMAVNFRTFEIIVNEIGGVDIDNPYSFSTSADAGIVTRFEKGPLHLSGEEALAYVRERQNLINGDFGRNEHQAIVLKAILEKVTSPVMLTKIDSLLTALEGQFLTTLDSRKIYKLAGNTLDHEGGWNIIQYHLDGIGEEAETASIPGMRLYVARFVKPQAVMLITEMKKVLNSEIVKQEELPLYEGIPFDPDEYKRENEYNNNSVESETAEEEPENE